MAVSQSTFDFDPDKRGEFTVKELAGLSFGHWSVVKLTEIRYGATPYYLCRCVCGKERDVSAYTLVRGKSSSCGCQPVSPEAIDRRARKLYALERGKNISCADCGAVVPRTGPQKYCRDCSAKRDHARKIAWGRANRPDREYSSSLAAKHKSRAILKGEEISVRDRWTLQDLMTDESGFAWVRRFAIDFSYTLSKNYVWGLNSGGHAKARSSIRASGQLVAEAVALAIEGIRPVENKVWIDLLIEKPNHLGDAINVMDRVVDGLKRGLGIDDRWFSIRRLDWRIVKLEPKILIGIAQEHDWPARICSYCGRALPHDWFTKSAENLHGVGRECKECRRIS